MIKIEHWLRQYGLAVCCVVCPIFLASLAYNWTVNRLVPTIVTSVEIAYHPAKLKARIEIPKESQNNSARSAASGNDARKEALTGDADPNLYLLSKHLAGRYTFAIASEFLYLVSIATFLVASVIVIQRLGWIILGCGVICFGLLAFGMAGSRWISVPFDVVRPLLIDRLFNEADKFEALRPLAIGTRTGDIVANLVALDVFIGLFPIGILLLALFSLSVRESSSKLKLEGLKIRLNAIRCLIILCSAIFVMGVILTKAIVEWPLTIIDQSQAAGLRPLADVLTLQFGATGTMIILSAFAPAVTAWSIDVRRFRSLSHESTLNESGINTETLPKDITYDSLVIAPKSALTSLMAIIAPLIVSTTIDALKTAMGVISPN
jgi:hypothetical protein